MDEESAVPSEEWAINNYFGKSRWDNVAFYGGAKLGYWRTAAAYYIYMYKIDSYTFFNIINNISDNQIYPNEEKNIIFLVTSISAEITRPIKYRSNICNCYLAEVFLSFINLFIQLLKCY